MKQVVDRVISGIVIVAGLAVALSFSQPAVGGGDLWWHLAAGRQIWDEKQVPGVDQFSYTFQGHEWMNHEWLWDVVFWGAYQLSRQAVAWLDLGIVTLILGLLWLIAARESRSAIVATLIACGASATLHFFFDIRPHLFNILFLAFFILTRRWRWAPYTWPALFAVWCNIHAGFVFGIGAVLLYVVIETIDRRKDRTAVRSMRTAWLCVGFAGAACLLNPWGAKILQYPFAYLSETSPYRSLALWGSPPLSLDLSDYSGRFWLLLLLSLPGAYVCLRRDPYLVALLVVAFLMTIKGRLFIPLFVTAGVPVLAVGVRSVLDAVQPLLPRQATRWLVLMLASLFVFAASVRWRETRLYPDLLGRWTKHDLLPHAALEYLKALKPGERLFNYYNWGGFIMLEAPEFKVYIDGRANTLYDNRTYSDYLTLSRGAERPLPDQLPDADAALVPTARTALLQILLHAGWVPVYGDPEAIVLLPPDSERLTSPRPDPATVLRDEPLFWLGQAEMARRARDFDRARDYAEHALAIDPLMTRGYLELAMTAGARRDVDGIDDAIARGIEQQPRRREWLKQVQVQALANAGAVERAIEILPQARARGPAVNPRHHDEWAQGVREQMHEVGLPGDE